MYESHKTPPFFFSPTTSFAFAYMEASAQDKENHSCSTNPYLRKHDHSFVQAVLNPYGIVPREQIHFCYLISIRYSSCSYTTLGYRNNPRAATKRKYLRKAKLPKGIPPHGQLTAIIGPFTTKKHCKEIVSTWRQGTTTESARIKRARELAKQNNVLCWTTHIF